MSSTLQQYKKGFTLLELLIVIIILGVLAALIAGNFVTSLKKGRDVQRKSDLEQMQRADELYYQDNGKYAQTETDFYGGTSGDEFCAPESSPGANDGCNRKIYMLKVPKDPLWNCIYDVDAVGTDGYAIYAPLENLDDNGPGTNQTANGYSLCSVGCCPAHKGRYAVTSPNVTPPP